MTPTITSLNSQILMTLLEDYEALKTISRRMLEVNDLAEDRACRDDLRVMLARIEQREGRAVA